MGGKNSEGPNGWFGPAIGTLTIDMNNDKTHITYDAFKLNWLGSIFIGPNNPKDANGKWDYSKKPQDVVDAGAKAHDLAFDKAHAAGISGVLFNNKTLAANIQLVRVANKAIDMYNNKEIDPFTKAPVSEETLKRAQNVSTLFTGIIANQLANNNKSIEENQQTLDHLKDVKNMKAAEIEKVVDPIK